MERRLADMIALGGGCIGRLDQCLSRVAEPLLSLLGDGRGISDGATFWSCEVVYAVN